MIRACICSDGEPRDTWSCRQRGVRSLLGYWRRNWVFLGVGRCSFFFAGCGGIQRAACPRAFVVLFFNLLRTRRVAWHSKGVPFAPLAMVIPTQRGNQKRGMRIPSDVFAIAAPKA